MTRLPLWKRSLYLIALAQLPFTTLMGLLIVSRGGSLPEGLSPRVMFGTLLFFLIACLVAALPAWFILRMGPRPSWWKGALIPASVMGLMLLGLDNFAERRGAEVGIETPLMIQVTLLMVVVLGIPGGMIGARMASSRTKLAARKLG